MIRAIGLTLALIAAPTFGAAHGLVVFASATCDTVVVEAKFSNGRVAQKGDVRVLDGSNTLIATLQLGTDGMARVPLAELDAAEGLVIEVDTGGHDNYWILTPEDIVGSCDS